MDLINLRVRFANTPGQEDVFTQEGFGGRLHHVEDTPRQFVEKARHLHAGRVDQHLRAFGNAAGQIADSLQLRVNMKRGYDPGEG